MSESRYAILIGVNDYQEKPLSYCVNDVRELKKTLELSCGFETNNIKLLTSDKEKTNTINISSIEREIKLIQKTFIPEQDVVLLYFSGHGIFSDKFKIDLKDDEVELDIIFQKLKELAPKNLIMIIDACHSGYLFELKSGEEISMDDYYRDRYKANLKGFYFLASCDENEKSKAYKEDELSKYTKYLIEAIKNQALFVHDHLLLETAHANAQQNLRNSGIQSPHIQINSGGFVISDKKFHKVETVKKLESKKFNAKLNSKTAQEYFEESLELIKKVKTQLKTFDGIIRGYIFKDYTGKAIFIEPNDYPSSISEAVANGIIDGDEDGVELNTSHKLVAPLFDNLNKLEDLYGKISNPSEFMELFEEEFEMDEFDLSNKEFWETIFETKIFFN